jgi:BMFP domain-containing protein YqiC
MKFNSTVLEETITKLKEVLPGDLSEIKRIHEEKLRMVLEGMLQKMDLVSRNEYDIQTEVLKRTRERLAQLEQRISDLEQK